MPKLPQIKRSRRKDNPEARMSIGDHLRELRQRLFVSAAGVMVMTVSTENMGLLPDRLGEQASFFLLVLLIVVLLLVIVLANLYFRPLVALTAALNGVADGNLDEDVDIGTYRETKEISTAVQRTLKKLKAVEQSRQEFVSNVSHELKTPLAAIRLLADSIEQNEGMDEATMREFVSDIGTEADRLQRTTEKLLDLSRRDDGASSPRVPVDLAEVARSTLRLLSPLAAKLGVSLRCEPEAGCIISAPEDDVYQIIFNLAENAVKYNVEGGSVDISVRREGGRVLLIVEDRGIGIPEADLPNIFSRFYRVDKARSREKGGSGLGLSIVHDAVSALGGSIEVEAREGGGTRFTVSFPEPGEGEGA